MRTILLLIATTVLFACKDEEAKYNHPELGVVTAKHPEYIKARELCDKLVYANGFEINGNIMTSSQTVGIEMIAISQKANKTQTEIELIQKWAGELQPEFIRCMEGNGFTYIRK